MDKTLEGTRSSNFTYWEVLVPLSLLLLFYYYHLVFFQIPIQNKELYKKQAEQAWPIHGLFNTAAVNKTIL
jgi:hypothetical protein